MTIDEKREKLQEFCNRFSDCALCPYAKNEFCDNHSIRHAEEDIIKAWYALFFGNEPAPATTIKDSGERTTFSTGAVRDMHVGKGRMDLLPWEAIIEVSKHCEEGALKYGEHNVDKGIPMHSLVDSAFRHLAKYTIGMKDEPHLRAAAWNLLWAIYMEIKHPELQDLPTRQIWDDKTESGLLEE